MRTNKHIKETMHGGISLIRETEIIIMVWAHLTYEQGNIAPNSVEIETTSTMGKEVLERTM